MLKLSSVALAAAVSTSIASMKAGAVTTVLALAEGVDESVRRANSQQLTSAVDKAWRGQRTPVGHGQSRRKLSTKASKVGDKTEGDKTDVGVLCPDDCPPGFASYCEGVPQGDACGADECCIGVDACKMFTGCVKKDGSCNGTAACAYAYATSIKNSCKDEKACYSLAYDRGEVGEVKNSCEGASACSYLAAYEGTVGALKNSCSGTRACKALGKYGGEVGEVKHSCEGASACSYLAAYEGTVGALNNSCSGTRACKGLGEDGGVVSELKRSCIGEKACAGLAYVGAVGSLKNSCIAKQACMYLGEVSATVGDISKSCNEYYACGSLGSYSGEVRGVTGSCNAKKACFSLASSYSKEGLDPNTKSSVGSIKLGCNTDRACARLASMGGSVKSVTRSCNSKNYQPCQGLAQNNGTVDYVDKWRYTEILKKYSRDEVGSAEACNAECAETINCEGIEWKNSTKRPCSAFERGSSSLVECGWKNICISMMNPSS